MWLLGPAGAGKSAIAQTLAERCKELGILLATFFFFRSDGTRNHSRSLFATIAYQLAVNFPAVRHLIVKVPEDDPMVFTQSIEEQLLSLIIKPLQELYHSGRSNTPAGPYLIIIDGLDECEDPVIQTSTFKASQRLFPPANFP
jgi:hypothetical protein